METDGADTEGVEQETAQVDAVLFLIVAEHSVPHLQETPSVTRSLNLLPVVSLAITPKILIFTSQECLLFSLQFGVHLVAFLSGLNL